MEDQDQQFIVTDEIADAPQQIFKPTNRDMRVEYPELTDIVEFNPLNNKDLRFVWFYACKSSELSTIRQDGIRLEASVKMAYGKEWMSNSNAVSLMNGDVPDDFVIAISKMRSFIPAIRTKANKMALSMFETLEKITVIDDFTYEAMDFDDKKAYVGLAKTVSDILPNLISQIEIGFSVIKKQNDNNKEDKENLMDYVIDTESI